METYRHGDVILRKIESMPTNLTPLGHNRLADGEVTGHAHRIDDGGKLFAFDDKKYLEIVAPFATLSHEEHKALQLPRGNYEIIMQREYDDEQEWRSVVD